MNTRGLLVAVALAAVLGGGIWWSLQDEKAKEGKPAADAPPKILEIPEGQFKRIEITRIGATEKIALERVDGSTWTVTSPKPYKADAGEVGSLVTTLSALSADKLVVDKGADLGQYGLNEPSITVAITTQDGKSRKLLVGDNSPMSGGYFAKVESDPRVFTIAQFNHSALTKQVNDFRDKRLMTFNDEKLARVELSAAGSGYELGRNAQNNWQIVKPKPMRAEGGRVEEILSKVKDVKMDPSLPEADAKKAEAAFASGALVLLVRTTDAAGTQSIEIRKSKDDYFAKASGVDGVHKVTSEAGQALAKSLDDLRTKKLFDFGFDDVNRLEVKIEGKAASYEKKGEDWTSAGKKMDNITIQGFVDKLRELSAMKFPDSGFTAPEVEIAVSSGNGRRNERVLAAKDAGGRWILQRAGEPTLYEVEAKSMDELKQFAAAIKEAAPPKAPDSKRDGKKDGKK